MVVVTSRTVCGFAAFCAAVVLGAPAPRGNAITYDQRQNGDYNVQVDLDGLSVLLLPGSEFAQRTATAGDDKAYPIYRRRDAVSPKHKHKKPPAKECSTKAPPEYPTAAVTTTASPAVVSPAVVSPAAVTDSPEYVGSGPEEESDATVVRVNEDLSSALFNQDRLSVVPESVSETNVPTAEDDRKAASDAQLSGTTPNFLEVKLYPSSTTENTAAVSAAETAVGKTAEKPVVGATDSVVEMVAVKTVDKPTESSAVPVTVVSTDDAAKANAAEPTTVETVSTSAEAVKPVAAPDAKAAENPAADKVVKPEAADDKSPEMTAVKTVEKPGEPENAKTGQAPLPAAETVIARNAEKPSDPTPAETPAVTSNAAPTNEKTSSIEPAEMIAMKTVEKPSYATTAKVAKKPPAVEASVASTTTETTLARRVSTEAGENPTEMVPMKTMEKPFAPSTVAEKSGGITASTKPVELVPERQDHQKTAAKPVEAATVPKSSSAPRPVEMVAVKTMDNPAAFTTVKSVVSVRTVIKSGSGAAAKTTLSSNGSTIMRKVGDRKPLPSVTLAVVPPALV